MDWDTEWMLEEDDDKAKLMPLNLNIKLPDKLPEILSKLIEGIIRAYHENNMGMYTDFEDLIEVEAKKALSSHKITKNDRDRIYAMLGWYVDG